MENSNFHNTEIIEVPKAFHHTCDYDSHRPFLWVALMMTDVTRPFSELGCGEGSTPVLRNYCKSVDRKFFSYETNNEYATKYKSIQITNYNDLNFSDDEYKQGVIFVDSAPGEQRKELIKKHANNSQLIVVHDTEQGAEYVYMMRDTLNSFKYRIDLDIPGAPSTTIVSNFIDLNYLKGKKILDYFIK